MRPVEHFHFLFSGFLQRWSDHGNGFGLCYRALRARYPRAEVIWLPWYVDPSDLAKLVLNHSTMLLNGERSRVTVAGYSFGGTTAVRLCEELYLQGNHEVEALCLVDAVKRRSRFPWGWWSAFNRTASFHLPPNVKRCVSYYQQKNWPRGHCVYPSDRVPKQLTRIKLPLVHTVMDNSPNVELTISQQAKSVHCVA